MYDRNGLYIPNLRQSDFKIFEDGKEQDIAYFGTSDKPFTVALLDRHKSVYRIQDRRYPECRDSICRSASTARHGHGDRICIQRARPRRANVDRQVLYKAIRKADFGNGTSIYDAVDFSLKKRLDAIEGRKAVVLFTDGVDTTSRKSSYDKTLAMAEESDALIFPIYYNTYFDNRNPSTFPPNILGGQVQIAARVHPNTLLANNIWKILQLTPAAVYSVPNRLRGD